MLDKVVRFFFRREVESTNLRWMAWHSLGGGTLAVEFQSGTVYAYEGVPRSVYRRLVKAQRDGESVGSTFSREVRNAGYAYERLS